MSIVDEGETMTVQAAELSDLDVVRNAHVMRSAARVEGVP
jgi:hypothetical protein